MSVPFIQKIDWQTRGKNNCKIFAKATLRKLPKVLRNTIGHHHIQNYKRDYYKANLKLTRINKLIENSHIENQPLREFFDEERLKEIAEAKAYFCAVMTARKADAEAAEKIKAYCSDIGITDFVTTDSGMVKRSKDWQWWRRQLRKLSGRSAEMLAIDYGLIGDEQIYCSDFAVARHRAMKKRNEKMMDNTILKNEEGAKYSLSELANKTTANPELRRGELMTRIRGFDEFAKHRHDAAMLITVTCPSKYHATSNGRPNKKYSGASPRAGQQYHCKSWSRARAAFRRADLYPYGFRIAEPHKDATPHWHMLLFIEPKKQKQLIQIIRHYWMREDANEKGAHLRRVDVEFIDRRKGSAASYVAKYVSKNIDGYGVGAVNDVNGRPVSLNAAQNAERVSAWSSLWGIRQFQQIGGEPVSIYRTLRRTDSSFTDSDCEQARINADEGNWDLFLRYSAKAMLALTKEQPEELNRYDEPLPPKIIGVHSILTGEFIAKKSHDWEAHFVRPWTCVNNCTQNSKIKTETEKIPITH